MLRNRKVKNMSQKLLLFSTFMICLITWSRVDAQTTSWQWLNPLPQGNTLLGVSFMDANAGTAVGYNGTILRTLNGGKTWTIQSSGTTNYLHGLSFTDPNMGTVVGDSGTILRTSDAGATWMRQASGTTNFLTSVFFTDANTGTAV